MHMHYSFGTNLKRLLRYLFAVFLVDVQMCGDAPLDLMKGYLLLNVGQYVHNDAYRQYRYHHEASC